VKRLELSGLSQTQAEKLTTHICAVVAGTLERLEAKFATKTEAERVRARRLLCLSFRRRASNATPRRVACGTTQTTFLQETAFGMFRASTQTTLDQTQTAMKRDCDAVRAECEKLRTGERHRERCVHVADTRACIAVYMVQHLCGDFCSGSASHAEC
jgi:hypothetical protein